MFGLGVQEFLILLAIVLLLFGWWRLPEIGQSFGRALQGFKRGVTEEQKEQVREPVTENAESASSDSVQGAERPVRDPANSSTPT